MYKLTLIKILRTKSIFAPITFIMIFISGFVSYHFFGNTLTTGIVVSAFLLMFVIVVFIIDEYTIVGFIEFNRTNIEVCIKDVKKTFNIESIENIEIMYDNYEGNAISYTNNFWKNFENQEGIGYINILSIDKSLNSFKYIAKSKNTIVIINKLLENYKSLGIQIDLKII